MALFVILKKYTVTSNNFDIVFNLNLQIFGDNLIYVCLLYYVKKKTVRTIEPLVIHIEQPLGSS